MESNVENLNELLSDLEVMSVKLQNYHWNVQGKGFFQTHEDFSKNSEIEEAKNEKIKSIPIIKNVVQDFKILERKVLKIKKEAEKQSDYATSTLMDNYLQNYTKKIWMLNATIK